MPVENTLIDPELIQRVKEASGESRGMRMPYIPTITINNKSETKQVEVDGKKQEVKIPPKVGFNIRIKNGDSYETKFFGEKLEAVVLKERYKISSKYQKNPAPGENFYSFEFDKWDEPVKVMNSINKNVIAEAPYKELKKRFETNEVDSRGNNKKSFDTLLVLYIDINDEPHRFQWKMTTDNGWFDYRKGFGDADTYVAYKTKFNLKKKDTGGVSYYYVEYEKGDPVDLAKEVEMQKSLQKLFSAQKSMSSNSDSIEGEVISTDSLPKNTITPKDPQDGDEVDVDSIPF